MCDYKCSKQKTLTKHTNTKHPQQNFPCEICEDQFVSKADLKSHMERENKDFVDNHKNEHNDDGHNINIRTNNKELTPEEFEPHGHECFLCEDNFSTQEEYDKHVNEHLQEVNEIDIESLKSGDAIFKFNLCDFQSGQTAAVKDHLKQHIQITLSTTNYNLDTTSEKERRRKNANKQALMTGNLLDLYDADGNPYMTPQMMKQAIQNDLKQNT